MLYFRTTCFMKVLNPIFLSFSEYNMSRPASACSMVSALIASNDQGQLCPVCGCHYDSGKQRKLVDTNCGHARCFKCMFNVEQCPMCLPTKKHQSCISRESGFQSFNGSVSSIYTWYVNYYKKFKYLSFQLPDFNLSVTGLWMEMRWKWTIGNLRLEVCCL